MEFTVVKYHKYQPAVNTDPTQKTMLGKTQLEVIPVCTQQLLKDAFSSLTAWIITLEQLGVQWELSLCVCVLSVHILKHKATGKSFHCSLHV